MQLNNIRFYIMYVQYISSVILLTAFALGLYTQYQYSHNDLVLGIAILGLFMFGLSFALRFYFNHAALGSAILHLWLGCIFGVIVFSKEQKKIEHVDSQELMDALFLACLAAATFWNIIERILFIKKHRPFLCETKELQECLGMCIATLITGNEAFPFSLFVLSVMCHLAAIRIKSVLGILSFLGLLPVSIMFFNSLTFPINVYGMTCFVGRLIIPALLDLYFNGLTTLERWHLTVFQKSRLVRHLGLLLFFILNLTLLVINGKQCTSHKEWFIVVPIFVCFSVIWGGFHLIYLISCWKLMNKISECNNIYNNQSEENKSLNRILSSRGIRHFCLVPSRLIGCNMVTTLLLLAISWTTKTGISLGLLFIVLPIECMTYSLFRELGYSLGGTAIGYAIITPVTGQRSNGHSGVTLYSYSAVQEIGAYATATLNKVCHFFNHHMIDNFGTDYSSSGMTQEFLESKVKAFFERRSSGEMGPRYDTYLLYFSGDTYESGDWALTGNKNLKLDTLLEWWSEKNADSGARLILVLDTNYSYHWAKYVKYVRDDYVAIQTCQYTQKGKKDLEQALPSGVGSFSHDWVQYNITNDLDIGWSSKERLDKAVYGVSRNWTDFTFHMPTEEDIKHHCDTSFPRVMKSLVRVVNYRGFPCTSGMCCSGFICRCLRRKQMSWLPPKEIDTKHGFKIVKS